MSWCKYGRSGSSRTGLSELANSTDVQADHLERVLDNLVNEDLIARDQDGTSQAIEAIHLGHTVTIIHWQNELVRIQPDFVMVPGFCGRAVAT